MSNKRKGIRLERKEEPSERDEEVRKVIRESVRYKSEWDDKWATNDNVTKMCVYKPYGLRDVYQHSCSQSINKGFVELAFVHTVQTLLFETYSVIFGILQAYRGELDLYFKEPRARLIEVNFYSNPETKSIAGSIMILRHEWSESRRRELFSDRAVNPHCNENLAVVRLLKHIREPDDASKDKEKVTNAKEEKRKTNLKRIMCLTPIELFLFFIDLTTTECCNLGLPMSAHFSLFYQNRNSWTAMLQKYSKQSDPVNFDITESHLHVRILFSEYNALVLLYSALQYRVFITDKESNVFNSCVEFLTALFQIDTSAKDEIEKQIAYHRNIQCNLMYCLHDQNTPVDERCLVENSDTLYSLLRTRESIASQIRDQVSLSTISQNKRRTDYSSVCDLFMEYDKSTFGGGDLNRMPQYLNVKTKSNVKYIHIQRNNFASKFQETLKSSDCLQYKTDLDSWNRRQSLTVRGVRSALQLLDEQFSGHDCTLKEEIQTYQREGTPFFTDRLLTPRSLCTSTCNMPALDQWILMFHRSGSNPEQTMTYLATFASIFKLELTERSIIYLQGGKGTGKSTVGQEICKDFLGSPALFHSTETTGSIVNMDSSLFTTKISDENYQMVRIVFRSALDIWNTKGDAFQLDKSDLVTNVKASTGASNTRRRAVATIVKDDDGNELEEFRSKGKTAYNVGDLMAVGNHSALLCDPAIRDRMVTIEFASIDGDNYELINRAHVKHTDSDNRRQMYVQFAMASHLRACGLATFQSSALDIVRLHQFVDRCCNMGDLSADWVSAQSGARNITQLSQYTYDRLETNVHDMYRFINEKFTAFGDLGRSENMSVSEMMSKMIDYIDQVADYALDCVPLPTFVNCTSGTVVSVRDVMRIVRQCETYSFFSAFISGYYCNVVGRGYNTREPFASTFKLLPLIYQLEPIHVLKVMGLTEIFNQRAVDVARGLLMLIIQWKFQNRLDFLPDRRCFVLKQFFQECTTPTHRIEKLTGLLKMYYPTPSWTNDDISLTIAHLSRVGTCDRAKKIYPLLSHFDITKTDKSFDLHIGFDVIFIPRYLALMYDATCCHMPKPVYTVSFNVKPGTRRSLELLRFKRRTYTRDEVPVNHPLAPEIDDIRKIFTHRAWDGVEHKKPKSLSNDIFEEVLISSSGAINLFFTMINSEIKECAAAKRHPAPASFSQGSAGDYTRAAHIFNLFIVTPGFPNKALLQQLEIEVENSKKKSHALRSPLVSRMSSLEKEAFIDEKGFELGFRRDEDHINFDDEKDIRVPPCISNEERFISGWMSEECRQAQSLYSTSDLRHTNYMLVREDYARLEKLFTLECLCSQEAQRLQGDRAHSYFGINPSQHCLHPDNIARSQRFDAEIHAYLEYLQPIFRFTACEEVDGKLYHSIGTEKRVSAERIMRVLYWMMISVFKYFFWKSTLHGLLSLVDDSFIEYECTRLGVHACGGIVSTIPSILNNGSIVNKLEEFERLLNMWLSGCLAKTHRRRTEIIDRIHFDHHEAINARFKSLNSFVGLGRLMFIPRLQDLPTTTEEKKEAYYKNDDITPADKSSVEIFFVPEPRAEEIIIREIERIHLPMDEVVEEV